MERTDFTFRQAQSAFDLISILQSYDDEMLLQSGGSDLPRIVKHAACRLEGEADAGCYETLISTVLEPDLGAEVAVAALVSNELQRGFCSGDAKELAEMATESIRSAPSKLRSAILRGLDTLEDYAHRYEPASYLLPDQSRLTRPQDQILQRLCQIARGMDQQTRQSVAKADYGYRADEHLHALDEVLSSENCQFPKDETWFPSEVVELVAHVRETPGFVVCTALLLANALPTNDSMGWFEFRWERLAAEYNALPDSVRYPILAGFRYLYEADKEFLWYSERKNWHPVEAPEFMISWA
ncbi:hypothetical protein SAMN05444273_11110 [Litoreibacter ascidiaceicola]|uniref:Uncharacterized protein n=1 Tax=Litoreibacter ascidiaceicola TaxID=1486859 RepID=A0A1M5E435_9RHOB|nr:hypothetical protein [Litoreibacter ascidiaceicola]SHF73832.1 hypothetical protein SAMN05444273_11110 [Litoreibacter ascidiaceicola]